MAWVSPCRMPMQDKKVLPMCLNSFVTYECEPYNRVFCRDFFAFGKEVSSGIWLRPEAALGKSNHRFHDPRLYRWPDKRSIRRCLVKISLSRGFFVPCVEPNRLTSCHFDRFARAQAARNRQPC